MSEFVLQVNEFEQLMADLASGSEDAAWRITEVYTPHILKAVRASLPETIRPNVDSQDFAQAVWASLLLKRGYLAHVRTPEQLIALLASTARNKVVGAYRHYTAAKRSNPIRERDAAKRLAAQPGNAKPEEDVESRELSPSQFASMKEHWQRAISNCSPRDKKILAMRMRGATYDTISRELALGVGTVRGVLNRVTSDLCR